MEIQKVIVFNGIKYRLMGSGKYYLSQSTTNRGRIGAKGLHVAIWEFYNKKKVPKGCHIHHKDGNTFNNDISNLECISSSEHAKKHFKKDEKFYKFIKAGISAAKKWHSSEEGRKWHSKHGKEVFEKKEEISKKCEECGKDFTTKQKFARFCSDKCGEKWRGHNRRIPFKKKCIICGKEFEGTKYKKSSKEPQTCSKFCANKLNHKNRKEKSI
ncbi:HNH endonuclease signature motif containing protein [Fusobacterium gastrosuis]|uniref:HNH endonuclease signature motif containing protein n=1 Tax=Fusobacterium gastrosuis TaxID=1755100 RepID=UPI00345859DC